LFAEPFTGTKVEIVTDSGDATNAANDESVLLIRIPKIINRKRIDEAIDRILASEMQFERGRKVRNPSRSNARYHLSKPVKVESLKEAFEVYELERDAKINGTKISNLKLAKAVGIEVQQKKTDEQAQDYSYQSELINTKVWRRKKLAKDAIANVIKGKFV
jgi:hypothetical protein